MRKSIETIKKLGFELIVVFVGMTAAIALDNYRQHKFQRAEERELLQLMITDLNTDLKNLNRLIQYDSARVEGQVGTTKYFKSERFSYNSLFSSQRVNLISSTELRLKIFKYYELCDETDELNQKFLSIEDQITRYVVENDRSLAIYSKIDSDSIPHYALVLQDKNSDQVIGNYRILHSTLLGFKNHYQKRLKVHAMELVDRIEGYINQD